MNQKELKIVWTALAFVIYIIFVLVAWSTLGTSIITFYTVPVVISAWFWGTRIGLLLALLNWPLNKLLIGLVSGSNPNLFFTPGGATGILITLFLGAVVGRLHDLSEQLRKEIKHHQADIQTLAERERFIDKVLGATPGIIYVFDVVEQRNVYTNRQITDYLGFSTEEITTMGSNFLPQLTHPEDIARLGALLNDWDSAADGKIIETTYRMKNASGEWRWFRGSYTVFIRDEHDQVTQIIGTASDITAAKQLEQTQLEAEKLQSALAKEKDLNQQKDRFMTNVSHELRTPLSIIGMAAAMLERYADRLTAEKRQAQITKIQVQLAHLTNLLDQVSLDIRDTMSKHRYRAGEINVASFCHHLIRFIEVEYTDISEIALNVADKTPALHSDEQLLLHALKNLLDNAIVYSPQRDDINFDVVVEGESMVFHIRDQGIGIPAADLDHVFEPYFRGSNVGSISGIGLGLKIAQDSIDLCKGEIALTSELDKGTTATVRLPLMVQAE